MSPDILPELKQITGALLFAAKKPLTVKEIHKTLVETAQTYEGPYREFAKLMDSDIYTAIERLKRDFKQTGSGLTIAEVAGGFRLQNETGCGPWVRTLLDKDRASKLSKPALETLAIVAYRQPCLRSEVEAVRGVSVDHVLRALVDMQLVKVTGRSELPGRPWLFGTTQRFLEHFGLRSLDDLPAAGELKRLMPDSEKLKGTKPFPEMEKELEQVAGNGEES